MQLEAKKYLFDIREAGQRHGEGAVLTALGLGAVHRSTLQIDVLPAR